MKKLLATLLLLLTLVTASAPLAQACSCRLRARRTTYYRASYPRYTRARYVHGYRAYDNRRAVYYTSDRRSFWQKHRDKLTVAIGTGYGAGLGALIGGRRGAGIGALAGGGGSALYTYGLRNRRPSYRRY